jgi:hypothetical protein
MKIKQLLKDNSLQQPTNNPMPVPATRQQLACNKNLMVPSTSLQQRVKNKEL